MLWQIIRWDALEAAVLHLDRLDFVVLLHNKLLLIRLCDACGPVMRPSNTLVLAGPFNITLELADVHWSQALTHIVHWLACSHVCEAV